MKVLRPELSQALGHDRFLCEITTTANLRHPHILPLFDSGEVDGYVFYVMPCRRSHRSVEGINSKGTLDGLLVNAGKLTPAAVLEMVAQ